MAKSKKKKRNRHSSVMVYVITMVISMVIMGVSAFYIIEQYFMSRENTKQINVKAKASKYTPDEVYNQTILFGLCESNELELLMLVRIVPNKKEVLCVPVPISTVSKVNTNQTTLKKHYDNSGTKALCEAVENVFDIPVQRYMIINNDSFDYIVKNSGGVSFKVPCDMFYINEKTNETTDFKKSDMQKVFYGNDLRKITTYPLHCDGEMFNVKISGVAISTLINQSIALRKRILENIDYYIDELISASDTNITEYDYTTEKNAFIFLMENAIRPATYSIPTGEWNNSGEFILSDDYKIVLKEYFYLT